MEVLQVLCHRCGDQLTSLEALLKTAFRSQTILTEAIFATPSVDRVQYCIAVAKNKSWEHEDVA